jgi:hypothetical protein
MLCGSVCSSRPSDVRLLEMPSLDDEVDGQVLDSRKSRKWREEEGGGRFGLRGIKR